MEQIFNYQGRDQQGNLTSGKLEAENAELVATYLLEKGITPTEIAPVQNKLLKKTPAVLFKRKIKTEDLMNWCRQLATLTNAGLPVVKSLRKLAEASTNPEMFYVLNQVADDVTMGMSLSNALKKHPHIFTDLIVNMVNVGENTGNLSEALAQVAKYLTTNLANHRRLMSALRYPLIVFFGILVALIVMNIFVIPKFADIFSRYSVELPWATRAIVASSQILQKYWYWCLCTVGILIFGIRRLLTFPQLQEIWDYYKLRLPIFGPLQQKIMISQFAWSFSLVLRAGIPLMKGLNLVTNTIKNRYFSGCLKQISTNIEEGKNFSTAIKMSDFFSPLVIQMVEVSEEGQALDKTMEYVANYYDEEVDYTLSIMNELLEPILLVGLSGIVLVMALGIYFPLWNMIKIAEF